MLGIGYFKGQPTEFVIQYVGGAVAKQAPGLNFLYWRHKTQIAIVPTTTADASFIFNETTHDFQEVTIQGHLTYRIADPMRAAELLNYTIDPVRRAYISDQPERLPQRIINDIQTETRDEVRGRSLEDALRDAQLIAATVLARILAGGGVAAMGVELRGVHFLSVQPTPEVARALEAEYREALLRRADEAVSTRRAAAVEEERKIKENELSTEIALEEQRQRFIDLEGANLQREADYRGKAMEREAESRSRALELEAAVYQEMDTGHILALAANQLSTNAEAVVAALSKPPATIAKRGRDA